MDAAPSLGFKPKYISLNHIFLALAVGWFIWAGTNLISSFREYTAPVVRVPLVVKDNRFETPEATIQHFRSAVSQRNWRDEYECYSDKLKARFTLHLVICAGEMSDSKDLAAKLSLALQKFHLPADVLDRFGSLQSSVVVNGESGTQQREVTVEELDRARELRLKAWTTEIYPRDIDWPGLIEELQPLYFENFRRHTSTLHDDPNLNGLVLDHPCQRGIVWHLHSHTYDPVTELQTHDDRSEGMIIAIIRDDRDLLVEVEGAADDENESTPWLLGGGTWQKLVSLEAWSQGQKRAADRISLVRLSDGWKIDAVPYR